jgi:hypothetical protein
MRCPVGPTRQLGRPFARPLSLTRGSRLSDPSLPNRPCTTHASLWTPRPRRTPRPRPSPPWPFSSCPVLHSLPFPSLAHSQPSALASHRAHTQGAPPPFVVVSRPFCDCHRALAMSVASVSFALSPSTQDTPQFTPSLSVSLNPRSLVLSLSRRSSAVVDPCHRCASDAVRESSIVLSR